MESESGPVTEQRKLLISSEEIDQLVTALVAAQLKMPSVKKDKTNPFFKAKYADLSSVVATAEPIIGAEGLAIAQFVSNLDGATSLKTFLLHSSGQWMGDEMILHEGKGTPQDQGSAITYARRYAYCAALGIVSDEDDDGNAASRPVQSVPEGSPGTKSREESPSKTTRVKAPTSTGPNLRRLFALINGDKSIGKDDELRHKWAGTILGRDIASFTELTKEDVAKLEDSFKTPSQKQAEEQQLQYSEEDPERPFE